MRIIDSEKCIGCGLCVQDCVNNFLVLNEISGRKIVEFQERGRCLDCGHCNAICPQGAITGGNCVTSDDVATKSDTLLSLMALKRSVRQYIKYSEIPTETLEKIIFAGQTAPTDRNRKSTRIILVKKSLSYLYNKALDYLVEDVQKTGTINPIYVPTMRLDRKRDEVLWNAEYLVVIVGLKKSIIDAAVAAERMQLEAFSLGIGSVYRGDMLRAINNVQELKDFLEIKVNEEALVVFAMGKTKLRYLREAVKINKKVLYK